MKIAAIQLESKLDYKINLAEIRKFMREACENKVEAVFLPEVFYSMSDGLKATPYLVQDHNEHYQEIQKLASDFKVYVLGGSVACLDQGRIVNRSYNFSPTGEELGRYDKIHLFACDLSKHPSSTVIDEGRVYSSGSKSLLLDVGEYKLGVAICFDLRFPELFRWYSSQGANVLTISSAFTVPTGKAHWHTLVQARAIENQCYVVATGQWGVHNERMKTFGHSLIVDPWGEILADAGEGVGIIYAELSLERLEQVRERLSVLRDPFKPQWS
jgi:deaminated glutathione amidase